ncbi:MAG: hypothetical protein ABL949_13490 [Fimbriimonadaceae bacterium]
MLALLLAHQQQEPIVPVLRPGVDGRGRDPWVFRCIFEDRTRMLVFALGDHLWMAFNPETCGVYKVWKGDIDFRGKVWDFSQENSRSVGEILYQAPNAILPATADWTPYGVAKVDEVWQFPANGYLLSPVFDTRGWQRIFFAFDETGRKNRFRVDLIGDGSTKQWFESATHVESEKEWQWNFKRIEFAAPKTQVKVTGEGGKSLRNMRVYGDRPVWFSSTGQPLSVRYRGYELIKQTKGVVVRFDLVSNSVVTPIEFRPERIGGGWSESWRAVGPRISVQMKREDAEKARQFLINLTAKNAIWNGLFKPKLQPVGGGSH